MKENEHTQKLFIQINHTQSSTESLFSDIFHSEETLLFVEFSRTFDSIHRENMEQILGSYGFLKESVTAIRILYKKTMTTLISSILSLEFCKEIYWHNFYT